MDPTTAALQDLVYTLCQRLKSRDPSLEWNDVLNNIRKTPTRGFSALALASESVLQEVQHECDEAIVTAREHYNACLPVNSLPSELLAYIFQLGLEDYEWYTDGDHPAVVSLVCRQWNTVAVNSPGLWTRWCDDVDGPARLKRGRILSKSMGLAFYCRNIISDVWDDVSAEVGRWQDVLFDFCGGPNLWFDDLERLGKQNAPKLRKLEIHTNWYPTPHRTLDLFDPHDPCRLEDLALYNVPVVWEALNFEHLRRLQICDFPSMAPSRAELLRILELNSRLEYLCLSDMELNPETPELSTIINHPVSMDFLSYLEVNLYGQTADDLVPMMRFPHCKEIKIWKISSSDPDSVSTLTHLMKAIGNSIAVEKTRLSVDCLDFEISTDGGQKVEVCIENAAELALSEFIKVSIDALAASPAVTLLLKDNFSYQWTMHIISALAPLQSITALEFLAGPPYDNGDDVDVCNPLECLAQVMQQVQHAFSRLRRIKCCVNTVSELESLRRVVLCRHQAIVGQENAVKPLEEVDVGHEKDWDLQDRCDAVLDEIKALIPGGNLKILSQRWGTGPMAWNASWRRSD
ncbi:hypothetical protein M407DRAFT_27480 [Tulasnella calospora MUT 4182]|uniref:F-box domain-containing protein n=1 Tax=Tulasnella calospora MUT 4182 TaxID=1051891 RepID=A0A0C3QCF4_9AGAM|nr:hypothetical protein M407DRAFT_27480 [Tulasnella calospora MUT 4182]